MKQWLLLLLIASFGTVCLAQTADTEESEQTPAEEQADKKQEKLIPIGERYIRDYIFVPLRSGQSSAHRIVHRGIRTGTKVELLASNEETDYSLIRLANGTEGWIGTQYLQEEPTAAIQLQQARQTIERLSSTAGSAGEQLLALEAENRTLKQDLEQTRRTSERLSKELEHITSLSENAVALHEENQTLLKENEAIRSRQDTLVADNDRLRSELKRGDFLNGAIAVILGIIATLVIQYFQRSRKRSDWV